MQEKITGLSGALLAVFLVRIFATAAPRATFRSFLRRLSHLFVSYNPFSRPFSAQLAPRLLFFPISSSATGEVIANGVRAVATAHKTTEIFYFLDQTAPKPFFHLLAEQTEAGGHLRTAQFGKHCLRPTLDIVVAAKSLAKRLHVSRDIVTRMDPEILSNLLCDYVPSTVLESVLAKISAATDARLCQLPTALISLVYTFLAIADHVRLARCSRRLAATAQLAESSPQVVRVSVAPRVLQSIAVWSRLFFCDCIRAGCNSPKPVCRAVASRC